MRNRRAFVGTREESSPVFIYCDAMRGPKSPAPASPQIETATAVDLEKLQALGVASIYLLPLGEIVVLALGVDARFGPTDAAAAGQVGRRAMAKAVELSFAGPEWKLIPSKDVAPIIAWRDNPSITKDDAGLIFRAYSDAFAAAHGQTDSIAQDVGPGHLIVVADFKTSTDPSRWNQPDDALLGEYAIDGLRFATQTPKPDGSRLVSLAVAISRTYTTNRSVGMDILMTFTRRCISAGTFPSDLTVIPTLVSAQWVPTSTNGGDLLQTLGSETASHRKRVGDSLALELP